MTALSLTLGNALAHRWSGQPRDFPGIVELGQKIATGAYEKVLLCEGDSWFDIYTPAPLHEPNLLDAIRTLGADGTPIEIVSDSKYVVDCFNDRWWVKWERNGWKNSAPWLYSIDPEKVMLAETPAPAASA